MRRSPGVEVFAVESDAVQVTWSGWASNEITIEVGARRLTVGCGPQAWLRRQGRRPVAINRLAYGPGSALIGDLDPGTEYQVYASGPGIGRKLVDTITTPIPPPGRVLGRFASISDLHIGERSFGALATIEDPVPLPAGTRPYPYRCADAAILEAVAWGAQVLVVKGDLTADSEPAEFADVGRLLSGAVVPAIVALGNHDVRHRVDGPALLAEFGVRASFHPEAHDIGGFRVVVGHSPHSRDKRGYVGADQRNSLTALVAGPERPLERGTGPRPTIVVLHHPPQRWRWSTHYPPGIVQPDSSLLLREIRRANPRSLLLAGHTHRNRRYRLEGLTVAEVGSTKDFPGQWAGYTVYEGGVSQVVYRTAAPEVLAWTESTRRALGGIWGWWAAGKLDDRCWTESWPLSALS